MILATVVNDYTEALEWDLFHYWNMDILDERLTIRRLRNFWDRLPLESETKQDLAGIERDARLWDKNTWMLANILDGVNSTTYAIIAANSKNKPRPPKPYERPELIKKKKTKPLYLGKTIVDKGGT